MHQSSQQLIPHLSKSLSVLLICGVFYFTISDAFNFALKPMSILENPIYLKFHKPQTRSSYFGYTLVIRSTSILVGAPRAQSSLTAQRNIDEPGSIYRCSLKDSTCNAFVLESRGNINAETNEYTYNSDQRDYQWLGASMDGGPSDYDKFVVCAPRFVVPVLNDYLMHGICYWINNTLSASPLASEVQIIEPLRLKDDQIKTENGHQYYYYMLGELGLSAHLSSNNEEILIGAPGIDTWKGSVIRYRKNVDYKDPNLSRRDVSGNQMTAQHHSRQQQQQHRRRRVQRDAGDIIERVIPNPQSWNQTIDSYFGY